jgi:hypothetical protein
MIVESRDSFVTGISHVYISDGPERERSPFEEIIAPEDTRPSKSSVPEAAGFLPDM